MVSSEQFISTQLHQNPSKLHVEVWTVTATHQFPLLLIMGIALWDVKHKLKVLFDLCGNNYNTVISYLHIIINYILISNNDESLRKN